MANANTNLLQININPAAKSVDAGARTSAKNSQLAQQSGNEKFSATLDKVSAKIEQQAQPEQPAAEIQPAASDSQAAAPQGQNDLAQDAPQILSNAQPALISKIIPAPDLEVPAPEIISQPAAELPAPENFSQPTVELPAPENLSQPTVEVPAPENISQPVVETPAPEIPVQPKTEKADAPEVEEVAPVQPVFVSANYFFTSNTETLLAPKAAEVPAATNLQTVLPQSSNSNSQSMLDLLGGKTWNAADVQASVSPQIQPTAGNNSAPVQTAPEILAAPQVQIQPQAQPVQTQPAAEIPAPVRNQPAPMIFARFQPQQQTFTQTISQPVEISAPQVQTPAAQIIQPVQTQPTVEISATPQIQTPAAQTTQPVEISAPQVQTPAAQIIQLVQTQPAVEIPATPQIQTPAAAQVQSVEISAAPQVQITAQPQISQQQAQPVSQALGVNVTLEEAPVSTPVIPVQQAPTQQQFSQPQQQTFAQAQPQAPAQPLTQPTAAPVSTEEIPAAQPVQVSAPVQPQISQPLEVPAPVQTENFQPPVAQVSSFETPTAQPQVQNFQPVQTSTEENSAAPVSDSPTPVLTLNNSNSVQQPLAQVQTPDAPAQAPREDFNVPAQIVQQARLIRTAENTEMVINLKPEHLGQLTLRISVSQNGAVNASFFSDNVQVRTIIENSLVQLRQELNEQGLKVENVQVYSGLSDGGLTNGQGQQAWQQNQQQNSSGRRINFGAFEEEVDALNPADGTVSADGVDYKI